MSSAGQVDGRRQPFSPVDIIAETPASEPEKASQNPGVSLGKGGYCNRVLMACHRALSERLKLDVWFADPHAPWQRGSNENTNGLLRQFMPKGIDLSGISQTQLNDMTRLLNGRPRKALDGRTPEEALNEEMAKYSKRVALDS